jgi:hypothetical protein
MKGKRKKRDTINNSGKRVVLVQGSKQKVDARLHISDIDHLNRGVDVTGRN